MIKLGSPEWAGETDDHDAGFRVPIIRNNKEVGAAYGDTEAEAIQNGRAAIAGESAKELLAIIQESGVTEQVYNRIADVLDMFPKNRNP